MQDSSQRLSVFDFVHRRRSFYVLPTRCSILSSPLLYYARIITDCRCWPCCGVQFLLCGRTACLRHTMRQIWACQHTLLLTSTECSNSAFGLALLDIRGPSCCFRGAQWPWQWQLLFCNAASRQFALWESEDACGDGHDHYRMGPRVLDGKFPLFEILPSVERTLLIRVYRELLLLVIYSLHMAENVIHLILTTRRFTLPAQLLLLLVF